MIGMMTIVPTPESDKRSEIDGITNAQHAVTKMTTWRVHLARYNNVDGVVLFNEEFLRRWGDQVWDDTTSKDDDVGAAAKLHIQLVSRITTQRLPYADGVEVTALDSVYKLFGEARDIFKAHTKSRLTEAVSWEVLNEHVRPFTAKWHRQSQRGALDALDETDIFRNELSSLQNTLIVFDTLLLEIRDGQEVDFAQYGGESVRERSICDEMDPAKPAKDWGIHPKLGGLGDGKANVGKINAKEKCAVMKRRKHYSGRINAEVAKAKDEAARQATAAADGGEKKPDLQDQSGAGRQSAEPCPPEWLARNHAVALAISGGGIRSATFALGVLVALARRNLLYQFDYLSTVSGGGYIGSFLTAFLNVGDAAQQDPNIGLLRRDLPFRREDGEAAALRHVRHHSKYLATGRLWERLQMTFTQVYGMALNGLGFAYLACVAALAAYFLRSMLPDGWLTSTAFLLLAAVAAGSFIVSMGAHGNPKIQKVADTAMTMASVALIALFLWLGLTELRAFGDKNSLVFVAAAVLPLLASATLALGVSLPLPLRIVMVVLSILAAPILFLGIALQADYLLAQSGGWIIGCVIAIAGLLFFWFIFDINFTSPHQHYKRKLGEAYLVQPDAKNAGGDLCKNVPLLLSKCTEKAAAPYHLINCALNVPASNNPAMQGRLTDFFLFSPGYCGSPLVGYFPTTTWEAEDPNLDLGTAMAISGAAAAPQMGLGTIRNFSFWLALFNVRLGYWIRNPKIAGRKAPPGLSYLLQEMFGWANETRPYLNVSDGGHIENLGVYELLRRRCRYIVAIDGEEDAKMTFQGLTTLQRLAFIDLGVVIEIGVDALRLGDKGLSHSHFAFCRIRYPTDSRDGDVNYGYLIYLKLSLTGNEGEFIRRYRLDEPAFPHHSTADQFFTEAQFEAYRSLGEHVGDKMFLPAIVGDDIATSKNVNAEKWFQAIGKSMLDPLAK
jgi:hypothetical protein